MSLRYGFVVPVVGAVMSLSGCSTRMLPQQPKYGDAVASFRSPGRVYDPPLGRFYQHVRTDLAHGAKIGTTAIVDCHGTESVQRFAAYEIPGVSTRDAIYIEVSRPNSEPIYLRRGLEALLTAVRRIR